MPANKRAVNTTKIAATASAFPGRVGNVTERMAVKPATATTRKPGNTITGVRTDPEPTKANPIENTKHRKHDSIEMAVALRKLGWGTAPVTAVGTFDVVRGGA